MLGPLNGATSYQALEEFAQRHYPALVDLGKTLIALVCQTQHLLSQADLTLLEQAQVVRAAFARRNR